MRFTHFLSLLPVLSGLAGAESTLGRPPESTPAFPTVRVEQNQRMLVMAVKGDPESNGDSAVQALLRYFFQGAGEAEKNAPVRPRVRWVLRSPGLARSAWIATYGIPVSESFPRPARGPASLAIWQYGLLAETAYAGSYSGAQPSIDSLKAYVARSGFAIIGGVEEEFERGRGTLYQGHPEAYRTFVRYRIHETAGTGGNAPLTSN